MHRMLRGTMKRSGLSVGAVSPRPRWWNGRPAFVGFSILSLLVLALLACELVGWRFLKDPLQRKLAETLGVEVRIDGPFDLHLLRPPQLSVGSFKVGAPAASGAPFLVDARDALLQWRWSDLWAYRHGEPLRVKRLEARSLEAYAKRIDAETASWKFAPSTDKKASAALPQFDVLRLNQGQVHVDDKLLRLVLEVQIRLNERARADGLPVTPWRLARSSGPYDDLSFGFAAPVVRDDGPVSLRNAMLTVAASDAAGFSLDAQGSYRDLPVTALLRAPSLMPLLSRETGQPPVMVMARASVGHTHMSYDGASVDLAGRGLAGDFTLSGPSLAAVGEPLGVTLPTTGPFSLSGHLRRPDAVWHARIDDAKIGRSQLAGDFAYDPRPAVPMLSGQLTGKRLALGDLGPAVGAEPRAPAPALPKGETASDRKKAAAAKPAARKPPSRADTQAAATPTMAAGGARRVIPDRHFDLPSLRAMNADVNVALDELDLNTEALEALRPLRTRVLLQAGVLHLDDLEAHTAGGIVTGSTSLDANVDPARWQADLAWKDVDLAGWLAGARKSDSTVSATSQPAKLRQERRQARAGKGKVTSYLTGELRGSLKLTGAGNSTAQILGSADGQLQAMVRDGTISHLAVEVMGLDVAQALGMVVKGDDSLPLSCAVVAIDARQGVLKPRVAVFDTRDSTLSFDGSINLGSEALDLRGTVRPKDFTVVSLRTPLLIRGTFGAPAISLEPVPLAGRVAAGAALALVNPFAAILPFLDPGDGEKASGCRKLATQASASADAKK